MKWLIVSEGCKLTPTISRTLELLDPFFENFQTFITSGLRGKSGQLQIIDQLVKKAKIGLEFPEYALMKGSDADAKCKIDNLPDMYWWERTYIKLLKLGYKVNPPCRVYYAEEKRWIEPSPHFKGDCFDMDEDKVDKIEEIYNRIQKALDGKKCFIKSYLVERKQDCVHVNCIPIGGSNV